MTELGWEQTSDTWNQEGDMCWVFIGCGCGNSGTGGQGWYSCTDWGRRLGPRYDCLTLSHSAVCMKPRPRPWSSSSIFCNVAEIKMFYNQPNNLKVIGKYNVESFTNISSLLAFQSNWQEVRIRGGSSHDGHDTWHDVMTPRNTSRDAVTGWHSRVRDERELIWTIYLQIWR